MARTRYIKPGFFKNEHLAELPPLCRLLWIGLWTLADREGRLEDRPKRIQAELFPYENSDFFVDNFLDDLQKKRFLKRYCVGEKGYIEIPNFRKHQHINMREQESVIPAPVNASEKHEKGYANRGNGDDKDVTCIEHVPDLSDTCTKEERPLTFNLYTFIPLTFDVLKKMSVDRELVDVYKEKHKLDDVDVVMNVWNFIREHYNLSDKRTNKTEDRVLSIKKQLKLGFNIFDIFEAMENQPFLAGEGNRGWKVSLDWLINHRDKWTKVVEGAYKNIRNGTKDEGSAYLKVTDEPLY